MHEVPEIELAVAALDRIDHFPERTDAARHHQPVPLVEPELALGLLQEDPHQRVRQVARWHHEPLPLAPHVHHERPRGRGRGG